MEENTISDSKLYELALDSKKHAEDKRDEINKYYPSLFTAIIAITPFLTKLNETADKVVKHFSTPPILIILSLIGLAISISWLLTLKRTLSYLEAVDKFLLGLEKKNNQHFIAYINSYLEQTHSPGRVTKQTMLGPYIFIALFIAALTYYTLLEINFLWG